MSGVALLGALLATTAPDVVDDPAGDPASAPVLSIDEAARYDPAPQLTDDGLHRMDAPIPPRPVPLSELTTTRATGRDVGTPTTLFVNFDGIELSACEASDSHRDCHWYNNDKPFEPFSGSVQTRISVLQAMRRDAADLGIRITGTRPPDDEDYTMVIYGGTEAEYGALGSAPSGDCLDQRPNQIAFAHVDGELNEWVNGGATTALHEAAHTWGLDHIDADNTVMFPAGNNQPTTYSDGCSQVVINTALEPAEEGSCPELNEMLCGEPDFQGGKAALQHLFGEAYVDTVSPEVTLVEPENGQYFQAPAEFDVILDIADDLHPQAYSMSAWVGDEDPPDRPQILAEPGFAVSKLPIGEWSFHIVIADESGNATKVEFTVEVGEDPPPEPEEDGACSCRAPARDGGAAPWWMLVAAVGLRRRRRA